MMIASRLSLPNAGSVVSHQSGRNAVCDEAPATGGPSAVGNNIKPGARANDKQSDSGLRRGDRHCGSNFSWLGLAVLVTVTAPGWRTEAKAGRVATVRCRIPPCCVCDSTGVR